MSKYAPYAEKIDSHAALQNLINNIGYDHNKYARPLARLAGMAVASTNTHDLDGPSWWAKREAIRIAHVYPEPPVILSEVQDYFPHLARYFPHISMTDPMALAYTATDQDGERDIQKTTTIGRFLRRFLPLMTDRWLQHVEQRWTSELDPNFLMATTAEEITRVYSSDVMVASCMRYAVTSDNFPVMVRQKKIHPVSVYAAPGMGVAYLEDGQGNVTARCVVWTNPADENDKRMVRLYGAPQLQTKLQRAGYKWAKLNGAKIKAIRLNDTDEPTGYYLMPYMDGVQGSRNSDGNVMAYMDASDPEHLQLICSREYGSLPAAIRDKDYSFTATSTTSGYVSLKTINILSGRHVKCIVSGAAIDLWTQGSSTIQLVTKDGTGWALTDKMPGNKVVPVNMGERMAYVFESDAAELTFTTVEGNRFLLSDKDKLIEDNTVCELSAKLYGEGLLTMSTRAVEVDEGMALTSDCVWIYTDANSRTPAHHSTIEVKVKSGDVFKLYRVAGSSAQLYATKGNPDARTTDTGKKVLIGKHKVVECVDGVARFDRSAVMVPYLSLRAWVPTDVANGAAQIGVEHANKQVAKLVAHITDGYSTNRARYVRLLTTLVTANLAPTDQRPFYKYEGGSGINAVRDSSYTAEQHADAIFRAAEAIPTDEVYSGSVPAMAWAQSVMAIKPAIEAALASFADETPAAPLNTDLPATAEELLGADVVADLRRRIAALAETV